MDQRKRRELCAVLLTDGGLCRRTWAQPKFTDWGSLDPCSSCMGTMAGPTEIDQRDNTQCVPRKQKRQEWRHSSMDCLFSRAHELLGRCAHCVHSGALLRPADHVVGHRPLCMGCPKKPRPLGLDTLASRGDAVACTTAPSRRWPGPESLLNIQETTLQSVPCSFLGRSSTLWLQEGGPRTPPRSSPMRPTSLTLA